MALKGKTVPEQIWNYLKSAGLSNHGTSGLMANLFPESGLNPKNLENLCETRLKEAGKPYCTDETYTAAVDSGEISREEFLHPLPNKQYGTGWHNGHLPEGKPGFMTWRSPGACQSVIWRCSWISLCRNFPPATEMSWRF